MARFLSMQVLVDTAPSGLPRRVYRQGTNDFGFNLQYEFRPRAPTYLTKPPPLNATTINVLGELFGWRSPSWRRPPPAAVRARWLISPSMSHARLDRAIAARRADCGSPPR